MFNELLEEFDYHKKTRIMITIDPELLNEIDNSICRAHNVSRSKLIEKTLKMVLKDMKKKAHKS